MIGFAGDTHMAAVMRAAAHIKGLPTTAKDFDKCDLVFIAQDVNSDADLPVLNALIDVIFKQCLDPLPIVLASQVPIGFTKPLLQRHQNLYYQVDTIIMNQALERAINPEQIIIGVNDVTQPLSKDYITYLEAFSSVQIVFMDIEAAELTKHAINYYLAAQLAATNVLSSLVTKEQWDQIIPALQNDERIGLYAYLRPGKIGGHLPRDVRRIRKLLDCDPLTGAIVAQCQQ